MTTDIIIIQLLLILLLFLFFLYFWVIKHTQTNSTMTNWPVLGMVPSLLKNAHRFHDFVAQLLTECHGNFEFKGPFLAKMHWIVTCDPANVHYILSKNFINYPKGPDYRSIFDILGNGIFNADGHLWELHRKTTMSLFNHPQFYSLLQETLVKRVEKGLIPVLDNVIKQGIEVDLQEILQRLAFDHFCSLFLDHDPQSLSIDLPYIPCEKALEIAEVSLAYRHLVPESIWKMQSWFGLGQEKGLSKAREAFDQFIYPCISMKHDQTKTKKSEQISASEDEDQEEDKHKLNLLTAFKEFAYQQKTGSPPETFLRDTLLNLMVAARDSSTTALTWFFWLLSRNPLVESKILDEIETKLHPTKDESTMLSAKGENLRKLVYLHGALCETLRLFPSVALEHKAPIQPDILPSGHRVDKNSKILLSFYAMGRMESLWGKDCLEFKPERWITERGEITHVPSYKFPAFNAGPRTCIGKEMSFSQMKIIAINILYKYKIEVVEGHPVAPLFSIIMNMRYGLKVRLAKRNI